MTNYKDPDEWAAYMRNYRKKLKKKAAAGSAKAQNSLKKESRGGSFRSAKSYILKSATKKELSELRDVIAERVKILKQKSKK